MSKWHKKSITKGKLGTLSKIQEELEEALDAEEQEQSIMLLIELSDIVGACALVAETYGANLDDLVKFAKLRMSVERSKNEPK